MDKKLVRGLIARLAQRFAFDETRLAHGEKDFSGCSGKAGREFGVGLQVMGQCAALPLPRTYSTILSAASSGVTFVVSIWISGFSGGSYGLSMPVNFLRSDERLLGKGCVGTCKSRG